MKDNKQIDIAEWTKMVDQLKQGNDDSFMAIMYDYYYPLVVELKKKYASEDEAREMVIEHITTFRRTIKEGKSVTKDGQPFIYSNLAALYVFLRQGLHFKWLTAARKKGIKVVVDDMELVGQQSEEIYNVEADLALDTALPMLSEARKQLPEQYQRIIEWRFFTKPSMEWAEIEKKLGKNPNAFRGIMPRILNALGDIIRQMYKEKGENFDLTF